MQGVKIGVLLAHVAIFRGNDVMLIRLLIKNFDSATYKINVMKKNAMKMYLGALLITGALTMASCKDNTTGSEADTQGAESVENTDYHTGTPAGSGTGGSDANSGMSPEAEGTTRTGADTVSTTTNNGNSTAQGSGTDNTDSRYGRE